MSVFLEANLNMNNMERNTAVAVKYVGNDPKYQVDDIISLGRLGEGSALRKVYCIVDEAFPAGTQIRIGNLTGDDRQPVMAGWRDAYVSKRGVFHIELPASDNFEANGVDYVEKTDFVVLDDHLRVGVKFIATTPSTQGSMRIVYVYDYIDATQSGVYL